MLPWDKKNELYKDGYTRSEQTQRSISVLREVSKVSLRPRAFFAVAVNTRDTLRAEATFSRYRVHSG